MNDFQQNDLKGKNDVIYADNASTTPICQEALEAMFLCYRNDFANPSSIHTAGRQAMNELMKYRLKMAQLLGCSHGELVFTASGSEGNNLAIRTALQQAAESGKNHIITDAMEHPSVLRTIRELAQTNASEINRTYASGTDQTSASKINQWEISILQPNEEGIITAEKIQSEIKQTTGFVSIMHGNNEIGVINPIREIVAVCHENEILVHTDAVQSCGHIPLDIKESRVDLLTISAHKFHGPKGVGALYINRRIPAYAMIKGGRQERNRRAGTENLPGIAGMTAALERAVRTMEEDREKLLSINRLISEPLKQLKGVHCNHLLASADRQLPQILSFTFDGVEAEELLLLLDAEGICVSAGSACEAGSMEPSHVIHALATARGADEETAKRMASSTIRISLSRENSEEQGTFIAETIREKLKQLRK